MGFMQRFEERVSAGKNSGKTQSGAQPGFIQRFERRLGGEELSQTARDTAARYQKIFQNYDWKSGLEYDEWDEEDQQRKAAGQLPKAIEKKYDFDDPIDVYLYQNGLPPKKRIAAYAKDAETKQAATQLEQQKKQVISRNLVAPVVAGFTGIPAETLQKGLSAQQGEQQFTQQPAQKSDKRPKPYALPTPQDIEVDTVSGAAPTGRKALEQMAEDDLLSDYVGAEAAPSAEEEALEREQEQSLAEWKEMLLLAMLSLNDADRELINALFFDGASTRDYAARIGITQRAVIKRRDGILRDLKKYFENFSN